ncbi:Kinesin- motor protein [Saxophila tyrrhenica]|uniref:Kinesin- motor protein n=1 Tax=Saxophila tyrrhenica TaxID=1690608 RepID=A0AAV9NXY1_9PEZI|nr:Kinesin- motor protein [Saxophila tyrrhenica]
MSAPTRPRPTSQRNTSTMRPPMSRPGASRAQTATPTLTNGRASPAESVASSKSRTPKRKAQSEIESEAGEETNINVVVRCRGRSDREVKENSGVVVSTDGTKGKKVELSMGPSALSNKTYAFDKVFSPAADQGIIFDDVVSPILDEVLNGFNCTIFAYGQTGTGKTYTMSGDITDMLPVLDGAGIIPRVLYNLFDRLGDEQSEKMEYSVKCSFIELYNEELRDLLAADDTTKLKIFDEQNKNGRTTTLVQGMEESHIKTASKGIQLLRQGSHRRQVAATKCNDLSSRSHTVFTVTVYMKRQTETGEDFVCSGKLNLVDLAGSENIQRSGAENKRAAEAGVINKSLLTLGRVINALVEKSTHIPYRESKLTRLLQDSLGGRTKTCIIATLSPAKSNLEETISTLDYAFRAKNIRNKPQINSMVSKKTLLREFTAEIEKLKSELIATRQRNGVYLTAEAYEEITTESESRRILSEEQRDKIETMERNLRNKVQELFALTTNFQSMKRDNEQTRVTLEGTKSVLDKTEIVLAHTKRNLAEEAHLRKAHQQTEEQLAAVGGDLLSTLDTTTDHVSRLHSKLRRRSDLQALNRTKWTNTASHVSGVTGIVEQRMEALRGQQEGLVESLSGRMQSFVTDELRELQASQTFLQEKAAAFEKSEVEVNGQTTKAKDEMNTVLEEIRTLRQDVKQKVGDGLNDLSTAAERISAGIATELDTFHSQLQSSYVSLGREFKTIFGDLVERMNQQRDEADRLRQQISQANNSYVTAGEESQVQLQRAIEEERQTAAAERTALMAKVSSLLNESAMAQETRISGFVEGANKRLRTSADEYRTSQQAYGSGMDSWNGRSQSLIDTTLKSREAIKSKLKADWGNADEQTTKLTSTTKAVHDETVRIVDGQMAQMDGQLVALDEIITRVRAQNEQHHQAHSASLEQLASDVQQSYSSIGQHFETSYARTQALDTEMSDRVIALTHTLPELADDGPIRQPLSQMRSELSAAQLAEYTATGETPAKTTFNYPTALPRTEDHSTLLDRMRGITRLASPTKRTSPTKARSSPTKAPPSPSKTLVWSDTPPTTTTTLKDLDLPASAPCTRPGTSASASSQPHQERLRELDVNIMPLGGGANGHPVSLGDQERGKAGDAAGGEEGGKLLSVPVPSAPHLLKRAHTNPLSVSQGVESRLPAAKVRGGRMTTAGGVENVAPATGEGRRLRPRGSD